MSEVLEVIENEILELERKLEEMRGARSAILRARGIDAEESSQAASDQGLMYVNMPPADAVEKYLYSCSKPVPVKDVIRELVRGGNVINKMRGEANIRIAIENSIATGRFLLVGAKIKKGDLKSIQAAVANNDGAVEPNPNWKGVSRVSSRHRHNRLANAR